MRGEIADYKESLRRRVALLQGVPAAALQRVYDERLQLNPGAERLVAACQAAGLKTLLVSGGFTFFTDRVRDRLGIDFTRANVLEIADGALTGRLVDQPWGDICDGAEKRSMLLETCAALGHRAAAGDRRRRRRQRPADDGRGRPLGRLPRQAEGARGGDGRDRRGRPRPPARGRPALGGAERRPTPVAGDRRQTTMPSASATSQSPGRTHTPWICTATSRSPWLRFSVGSGTSASARMPTSRRRELGDVAHAAVDDDAGPAVLRRRRGEVAADQRAAQRAAAVDDQHAAVARRRRARP